MKTKKRTRSILSLVLALCLVMAMSMTAFATSSSSNAAVNADATGTLQIKVGVTDKDDSSLFHILQTGTGFLINDTTMVTCDHVVNLTPEAVQYAVENYGLTEKQVKERTVIRVFLYRDDSYVANVIAKSEKADIAILSLKDSIKNRTYLTLRTSEVVRSEECYALGFPGLINNFDDQELNTEADVSIDSGIVNKITTVGSIKYVVNSALTLEGNSGGPLVDSDGHVIGVIQAYTSHSGFSADYSYAITIDEVVNLLNPRGIAYTEAEGSGSGTGNGSNGNENGNGNGNGDGGSGDVIIETPVSKSTLQQQISAASGVAADAAKCSDLTRNEYDTALANANSLNTSDNATQAEVDAAATALATAIDKVRTEAAKKAESSRMFMTIGIIAAAVVVAAIVMIMLLGGRKKKPAPGPGPVPPTPTPIPPVPPITPPPAPVGGPGTTVLNAGAGETTVLNAGAGETTVLNSNISLGTLTRVSTGEKININKASFTIGKERSAVDYCITGNSSVSRKHAVIDGDAAGAYIVDNGSTNGTSVNNVRLAPKHKSELNDGDRIQISDEEFIYNSPSMF